MKRFSYFVQNITEDTSLLEAKFSNTLDVSSVYNFAKKNKEELEKNVPSEVQEALEHYEINQSRNPKVYIFAKSIAYRIGRSSVKSISGFASGFKASFSKSNEDILSSKTFQANSKLGKVVRFALLLCLKYPNAVTTEEDSAEKQESEETIRTQKSIENLLAEIEEDYITVLLGSQQFNVDGFRQIEGRPKADMAFTFKGNDVIFVSHKLGSKPANFQQYGGFTTDLGYEKNQRSSKVVSGSSSTYILKFLENIDLILDKVYGIKPDNRGIYDFGKTPRGTNFALPITDNDLAGLVMFGKNYRSSKFGLDNVHIMIDGNIVLNKIEHGVYSLDGSFHSMINPNVIGSNDKFPTNPPYQPMLFVMRSAAQQLKQGGFYNARAVIWPRNTITENYYKKYLTDLQKAKSL